MNKCLVTGGCGFIGSNLALQLLKEGWQVDIVDDLSSGDLSFLDGASPRTVHVDMLPLFELKHEKDRESNKPLIITGDFSHENVLSRIKAKTYDTVFHVAALPRVSFSVKEPVLTSEVNLFKTLALFHACADNTKRVVFSSSSSVYGNTSSFPTPEATEKNPRSPYALQKLCSEKFASIFCDLYNVDIVSLRYFNVYGPHQISTGQMSTVIGIFEDNYKRRKPLPVVRPGTQTRRFTHIDDTVDICYLAWKKNLGRHYSIASKKSYSLIQVARLFNSNIKLLPKRPGERYASALTNRNLSNKIYSYYGKISLKNYISEFLEKNS